MRALRSRTMRAGVVTRVACAALASLALAGAAGPAVAAPDTTEEQLAAARERFKVGIELEDRGDWEAARKAFEDVAATKVSPQVLYHLALCDEHLGHWLDAVEGYDKALAAAAEVGDSARGVVESATKQRSDLAARIPRLRIEIRGALTKDDELLVDGKSMDLGVTVRDLKVDPGKHVAEIRRKGETVARGETDVAAGERGKLRVELPKEADAGGAKPPKPIETGGGVGKIPAYVVGGVGVAALIGAGVTFGLSRAAVDEVKATCGPDGVTGCDPALSGRAEDASTLSTTSAVLLGVGTACVATGVVLWFVLDDDKAPRGGSLGPLPRTATGFAIAPTAGGLAAFGSF